ncbi:MAG: hypothetical protein HC933_15610 [Pleurocapsa sp. SU_196_0]|nr:hypothetical protein [Pleurocapsa sp. SU_196_0]
MKDRVDRVKDDSSDLRQAVDGAKDKASATVHKANAEAHEVKARASDDLGTKVSETVKAGVDHAKSAIDDAKGNAKLEDSKR